MLFNLIGLVHFLLSEIWFSAKLDSNNLKFSWKINKIWSIIISVMIYTRILLNGLFLTKVHLTIEFYHPLGLKRFFFFEKVKLTPSNWHERESNLRPWGGAHSQVPSQYNCLKRLLLSWFYNIHFNITRYLTCALHVFD